MSAVFLKILNMSIKAGWLILAVVAVRFLLKKAPRWITCLLWGFVAIRLVCPFSFETVLSLIPSGETIPENIAMQQEPVIHSGITIVDETINPVIAESFRPDPAASVNPLQIIISIVVCVWIAGIVALLIYALVSYLKLRKTVSVCVPVGKKIFACDEVKTPFILGIFRPRIYVPSGISEETLDYVLRHENAHLKRHDHWWKPLAFLLLAVYWFNPLCWAAYILLCRDIETACDEKVIRDMDKDGKAGYSQALLDCSFQRKKIAACPLAFGEVGVKERVKGILNYKKPAFWVIILSVVACVVISVCFLTNPAKESKEESSEEKTAANYEGIYYYSGNKKETYGSAVRLIDLAVQIKDDGSFLINEVPDGGITSSGKHAVDGDMITLTGTVKIGEEEEKPVTYHFRLDGDNLIYVARNSSDFNVAQVRDGETFLKDKNPYDDYEERCYYYTRNGEESAAGPIWSWIDLMPDGGCMWMDSYISSSIPASTYKIEGDVLTITAKSQGLNGEVTELYRFRMEGNSLFYIAEGTSFGLLKLEDGDEYVLGPDFATEESKKLEEEVWAKAEERRKRRTEEAEAQRRRAEEASKQNKEGKNIIKEYQTVKIISEEIQNDEIIKREYMVSSANAVQLMKTLNPEGRSYSEDVIKSEFEKSYTIVIDDIPTYSLNWDVENGTDSVYMFDLRSTPISGTYISSDIVKLIDEIIEGE